MWPRLPHRPAFTLVELLAVIAVISVLSLLIIPIVGTVRKHSELTTCTSNLRALYTGFQCYTADHDGYFPAVQIGPPSYAIWQTEIAPYLTGKETENRYDNVRHLSSLFICPTLARDYEEYSGTDVLFWGNYGMSCALGSCYNIGIARYAVTRKITNVPFPARTVLLSESGGVQQNTQTPVLSKHWIEQSAMRDGQYIKGVHDGANNILWCDGHVSLWEDVRTLAEGTYVGSYADTTWAPGFDLAQ